MAGPEYAIRRDLLDFVVAELGAGESACPHRIGPVRTLLEKQRDNLLAFAVELDRELAALAQKWQISVATAREVLQVQSLPTWDPKRWHREAALRETLRGHYHGVCAEVQDLSDRWCGPAVWSRTSTAGCGATSSCGGSWARTT